MNMERLYGKENLNFTDKGISDKIKDFYSDLMAEYGDKYDNADIELYVVEELMALFAIRRAHQIVDDYVKNTKKIKF